MREPVVMPQLPRPGLAIKSAIILVFAVWIAFAVGINFLGLSPRYFQLLVGNKEAILEGQLWRLLTAGIVHTPSGPGAVWDILWTMVGLYFLAPSLERAWGARTMVLFLLASVFVGYLTQLTAEVLLPNPLADRLSQRFWFGAMPAVEAIAVAWALSNRGQMVNLFVIPVGARGLLFFVIGMSVLRVVAADSPNEGCFTPFGGMLAGYLFGGGKPAPARRALLKLRYLWLARKAARYGGTSGSRPYLRVIEGEAGKSGGKRPPSDKRFLN